MFCEFFHSSNCSKGRLLTRLLERLIMSVDALNATIATLNTNVDTLIASKANTVAQSDVDASTASLQAVVDKVVQANAPATPAPAPAV